MSKNMKESEKIEELASSIIKILEGVIDNEENGTDIAFGTYQIVSQHMFSKFCEHHIDEVIEGFVETIKRNIKTPAEEN